MQSMGVNNITVSLQQKSDSTLTVGGTTRMFRASAPAEEDLITDEMIAEYTCLLYTSSRSASTDLAALAVWFFVLPWNTPRSMRSSG